jgi:hypothetical protein
MLWDFQGKWQYTGRRTGIFAVAYVYRGGERVEMWRALDVCTLKTELSGSVYYESHELRFRAWRHEELNSAELSGPEVSS